jgi:hypothetical protein
VELAAIDRSLALVATTQPHARLVQVVRHYRQALDPDGEEPDPTEPHVVVTLGLEDLLGSAARPGAAATGFGQVLSAATALAGLRRADHPDPARPRRAAPRRRPGRAGGAGAPPPRGGAARPALRRR